LETGDASPLIAELSPQINSEAIEQLEFRALQQLKDFNFVVAFLTYTYQVVARFMVLFSLVLGAV
jgi:hypothetical protein